MNYRAQCDAVTRAGMLDLKVRREEKEHWKERDRRVFRNNIMAMAGHMADVGYISGVEVSYNRWEKALKWLKENGYTRASLSDRLYPSLKFLQENHHENACDL